MINNQSTIMTNDGIQVLALAVRKGHGGQARALIK